MDADAIYEAMYGKQPEGAPGTVKYARDERAPKVQSLENQRSDPGYVHRTRENVKDWASAASSPMGSIQQMLTTMRGGVQFTMKLDDLDDDTYELLYGASRRVITERQTALYMQGVRASHLTLDELAKTIECDIVPGMQRIGDAMKGLVGAMRDAGLIEDELPTEPKARALAVRQRRNIGPDNRPRLDGRRARR